MDGKSCQTESSSYTSYYEAEEACSSDPDCKMFYDGCGQGIRFTLCSGSKKNSGCGSVTYEKRGKLRYFDFIHSKLLS